MTRRFDAVLPWAVTLLAVVVWTVPLQLGIYSDGVLTDIPVYRDVHDQIAAGNIPYRDFTLEYPPLAGLLFWLAGILPGGYAAAFSGLMLACLIATALAGVAIARALSLSQTRQAAVGGVVAISPLLLGGLIETRYDLALAAATAWMLWAAVTRRFTLMWLLLVVAVLVKFIPLALIPVLLIWQRHERGTRAAATGCLGALVGLAAIMLPFVIMAPSGTWGMVSYHLDRPLQIESTGAAYLLGLHALADIPLSVRSSFGSQGLAGDGPSIIAGLASAALLALVAVIAWSLWNGLRRARTPGDARLFIAAACATVVTLLVTGKVLSPQFVIWLLPTGLLITGRYGRASFAMTVGALLATMAYFPRLYWDLVALDTWPIALLVLRDTLLIALLAACWPRPSIAGRPRGWVLRRGGAEPEGERAVAARYLAE